MTAVVWLNGEFIPEDRAVISVFDRGFLLGDGVFETMRSCNGRPFLLDRHIDRLFRSAAQFDIHLPETPHQLSDAVQETLNRNGAPDAYIRITVSRGVHTGDLGFDIGSTPTRLIHTRPLKPISEDVYRTGVTLCAIASGVSEFSMTRRFKTLSYMECLAARWEAKKKGAFDALFLDENRSILETATGNVFGVLEGRVVTAPIKHAILPGVMREWVIQTCRNLEIPVEERSWTRQELGDSREVFLTNSVIGIGPVSGVDSLKIPLSDSQSVTFHLMQLLEKAMWGETPQ